MGVSRTLRERADRDIPYPTCPAWAGYIGEHSGQQTVSLDSCHDSLCQSLKQSLWLDTADLDMCRLSALEAGRPGCGSG